MDAIVRRNRLFILFGGFAAMFQVGDLVMIKAKDSQSDTAHCSSLTAAVERLRVVDAYGAEWGNLLQDKDTDPQMAKDCVEVVRAYLREDTAKQVADLAMLVARLVKQIRNQDKENPVAERAMDYLRRQELFPSILRGVM